MASLTIVLNRFLPYQLSIASNMVSEVIARSYQQLFGLTIPEWRLLAVVADGTGLTQQAIAERTRMTKVTVSRAAIAMQTRGLVESKPNDQDGRSHRLQLTDAGSRLYTQVVPAALKLEKQIFDQLSSTERQALDIILAKICAAADEVSSYSA